MKDLNIDFTLYGIPEDAEAEYAELDYDKEIENWRYA